MPDAACSPPVNVEDAANVPLDTTTSPANVWAPVSVSFPSPFFTSPPVPFMPTAAVTSKALEMTRPSAPSVGDGRPDGMKFAAAAFGTSVAPSKRIDELDVLFL